MAEKEYSSHDCHEEEGEKKRDRERLTDCDFLGTRYSLQAIPTVIYFFQEGTTV
jgi:hypothetical protein